MKLVLKGHDERYVVEQGMLNLFPGERPVYEPIGPEDDTWARVSLREEADGCTVEVELSWRGTAATHRLDAPLTGDEFQREGLRRRAIGRCFFLAAHGVTGTAPPWGMLTGVRPVKLPTREMAAGATPEQARASLERDLAHMRELKDYAARTLREQVPGLELIGAGTAPHILPVTLPGYKSEVVLRFLSDRGIYVSSGSACHKGKPSHVYAALKLPQSDLDGALRISFSYDTTQQDVDALADGLRAAKGQLFPTLS